MRQSVPDATLQILGAGPYEGQLRSLISSLGLDACVTIESIAPDDRGRMARSLGAGRGRGRAVRV